MKKTLLFLLLVLISLPLSACSSGPEEDPQTVINKAWEKLADSNAEYLEGSIDFSGKFDGEFEGDSITAKTDLDIEFDSTDSENPKAAIKMDIEGSGSLEGQSGSVGLTGEVRTLNKTAFFFLEGLSLDTGSAENDLAAGFIENLFKGKWFSIPESLGLDEAEDIIAINPLSDKKIAEIAKKNNFIEVKESLGKRTYEVIINPEKFKTFIREMAKESGENVSEDDLKELDSVLANLDYNMKVTINRDYEVEWVGGDFTIVDPENNEELSAYIDVKLDNDSSSGTIDLEIGGESPAKFSVTFDAEHDDKSVNIEEPEGAKEFDPSTMLGLGAGL